MPSSSLRETRLGRARTLGLLGVLRKAEDVSARTMYVKAGESPPSPALAEFMGGPVPEGLPELISGSITGAVIFGGNRKVLILPPFPVESSSVSEGYSIQTLRSILRRDYGIALILIRLGNYAIGRAEGEKLVTAKAGTGLVHSRHRQGGSSAHRFERHRDKQIEYFLTRICGHIREELEAYFDKLDYVVYGGARTTILLLRKSCPLLARFDGRSLNPLLTIPDPTRATLPSALSQVWSSRVFTWD